MNVEDAYKRIANGLTSAIDSRWEKISLTTRVLSKNCSQLTTMLFIGSEVRSIELGIQRVFQVSDAVIYLRDDLIRTTGQRIWGFAFTLYPTGKFNIEYDYNKPEGYEESDDVITGKEINDSFTTLAASDKKSE